MSWARLARLNSELLDIRITGMFSPELCRRLIRSNPSPSAMKTSETMMSGNGAQRAEKKSSIPTKPWVGYCSEVKRSTRADLKLSLSSITQMRSCAIHALSEARSLAATEIAQSNILKTQRPNGLTVFLPRSCTKIAHSLRQDKARQRQWFRLKPSTGEQDDGCDRTLGRG